MQICRKKYVNRFFFHFQLNSPGKHVLAVVFFTPDKINPNATAEIIVNAEGDRKLKKQKYKKYKTEKMDLGMGMVSGLFSQLLGNERNRSRKEFA